MMRLTVIGLLGLTLMSPVNAPSVSGIFGEGSSAALAWALWSGGEMSTSRYRGSRWRRQPGRSRCPLGPNGGKLDKRPEGGEHGRVLKLPLIFLAMFLASCGAATFN